MVHPIPSTTLSADIVKAAIQDSCANQKWSSLIRIFGRGYGLYTVFNIELSNRALDELDKCHTFARNGGVVGGATFYFAYSTLDGRILYVDKMEATNNGGEEHILRLLGDVAVQLECQCLAWQVSVFRSSFGYLLSLSSLVSCRSSITTQNGSCMKRNSERRCWIDG